MRRGIWSVLGALGALVSLGPTAAPPAPRVPLLHEPPRRKARGRPWSRPRDLETRLAARPRRWRFVRAVVARRPGAPVGAIRVRTRRALEAHERWRRLILEGYHPHVHPPTHPTVDRSQFSTGQVLEVPR